MSLDESELGELSGLTRAIGLTTATGSNAKWFADPVGGSSDNPTGLKTMLANDEQRDALVDFIDATLGPPERHAEGEATWVPLFSNANPDLTVYAVLCPVPGAVRVGVAAEFGTGDAAPRVSGSVHVPIFQVPRGASDGRAVGGPMPDWLFVGRAGARIEIALDATFEDGPPTPGQAHLGGGGVSLTIPTAPGEDVGFGLSLVDLQLPGAATPSTHTLSVDDLTDGGELGADVLDLVVGLLRTHLGALDPTDAGLRVVTALAGATGLRSVTGLPDPAWSELPTRGIEVIVDWAETVLASDATRDLWLAELADLTGGTALPDQDAVSFTLGPADVIVGLRVATGVGGLPILTPWLRVAHGTRSGADVRAEVDLLRLDPATGGITALPALALSAVFGADAGGADLVTSAEFSLGSVHLGLASLDQGPPAFRLTLHDVTVTGGHHDHLDLSSPDAALDAADEVIDDALTAALGALGAAGDLLLTLIGSSPPAGIPQVTASALIRDPLGSLREYYTAVTGQQAAAVSLLGTLGELLTGAAPTIAGTGTTADPWRLPLFSADAQLALQLTRDGDTLCLAVGARLDTDVTPDVVLSGQMALDLFSVNLVTGVCTFAGALTAELSAAAAAGGPLRLAFGGATAHVERAGVALSWAPRVGLTVTPVHDHLGLTLPDDRELALTLPTGGPQDWDAVQDTAAALLAEVHIPAIDLLLDLVGWRRAGLPRLSLGALVADPADTLRTWAVELALDCSRLAFVMDLAASLFSGGQLNRALGNGSTQAPWLAPIAGASAAPGLALWTEPACPPRPPHRGRDSWTGILAGSQVPTGADLVAALVSASLTLPHFADLLVARPHLSDGLDALVERWDGTDGVIAPPEDLPDGVGMTVLHGHTFSEISAAMIQGAPAGAVDLSGLVVHVGCTSDWLTGQPTGAAIDASNGEPAVIPTDATSTRYLRLPTIAEALALRPGIDPVQVQAELIAEALGARTARVTLVGHGAAGAACLRAGHAPCVSGVVTVGTPWHPAVAVAGLQLDLPGDALRLLAALATTPPAPGDAEWLLKSPLQQGVALVAHASSIRVGPDLPSALPEALPSGTAVHAVFGELAADDVCRALAAVVAQAIQQASEASVPAEPMTSAHLGVHLPVADTDLGGITVGIGARLALVSAHAAEPTLRTPLELDVEFHLGVSDGWLVGGPGASSTDLQARWAEIHALIPLDGGPGRGYLVLHDATAFGVTRSRWLVTPEGTGEATLAVPEVKLLLGEIVARVITNAPELAALFEAAGMIRDGGFDPAALDTLLHDPASLARTALASGAGSLADALAVLTTGPQPGDLPAGTVRLGVATAYADLDLATGRLSGSAVVGGIDGLPTLTFDLSITPTGASGSLGLGLVDPDLGGVALTLSAGPGGARLSVDTATGTVELYPAPTADAISSLAADLLPAIAVRLLTDGARTAAGEVLDELLAALSLLGPATPEGYRPTLTPWRLFADPGRWLRERTDPLAASVALLDGIGDLLVPGAAPGLWALSGDTALAYAVTDDTLVVTVELDLAARIDGHAAVSTLVGGLTISRSGSVAPKLDLGASVDGWGARLQVTPTTTLSVIRPTGGPLPVYPAGPGLADALATGATAVVVLAVNRLIAQRTAADPLLREVATAVHSVSSALGLLDGGDELDPAALESFVSDPAGRLLARLPQLAGTALDALATALDPTAAVISVSTPATGTTRLALTAGATVSLDLVANGADTAMSLAGSVDLAGFGTFTLDQLRISESGVQVQLTAGPFLLDAGAVRLRPLLTLAAGVSGDGFTRSLAAGVSLDDAGDTQVVARWSLDATPPELLALTRGAAGYTSESDPAVIATRLLSSVLCLASGILLDQLESVISTKVTAALQEVVFTGGGRTLDPTLLTDLIDPDALFARLQRLAWNCATAGLSLTIDSVLTVGFSARPTTAGRQQVGIALSLPAGSRLALATGETTIDLEVDAAWIDAPVTGGLSIYVLEGTATDLVLSPGFAVAGLGVRIGGGAGPLLSLGGLSVDAISIHVYAEATAAGAGGGARVKLDALAISPSGAGGDNAVANGIMSDAGAEAGTNRPAFSPSLAIQQPPGESLGVTLRAGDPPGPWWLVVQRQLGPLYLEAVGLDTAESGGKVSRISLLFNGSVSIFGLTAAVDQLSISWLGGDVLSISSWSVDLMGLAVSADLSGIVLSGGLLKTVQGTPPHQEISYVGMLVARFATYGLSVFGGYSQAGNSTSFFVFGAIVGPIGGPPAFFLTGLGGGFGINRGLRVPTDLNDFPSFPFLQALDPGAQAPSDPMGELRRLGEYFPHQVGSFWFAAGLSFTCFSLVDGVAVVAVSFGNGLEINLLGLARMALPRPGAAIVSIELALLARFSTREGVFLIQAQLTENSWLLYEDVRLTGGFAFAMWWKGPLAGQFVLTLGGYHPNFHVEGYPVVPRLGLEWRISDALVIKGGSYFALTSEALMAGVDVEVSLDWGWVWAKVAFGAHGIVYFDPFWFEVMAYARISAGLNIKLGFFRIRISISIGAQITCWGPDFAGKATFEIGPCDVDIDFGSKRRIEPALTTWPEFVEKYLEAATTTQARALSAITGAGTLPSATGGKVGAASADGSLARPHRVFAEFELSITSTIPITAIGLGGLAPLRITPQIENTTVSLGIAPVGASLSTSELTITVRRREGTTWVVVPDVNLASLLTFARTGRTAYPLGVWGPPKTSDNDNTALPSSEVIDAGSSITLVAQAVPVAVGPQIDYYRVEASRRPLPLSASARSRQGMLREASRVPLVQPDTAERALELARATLYDRGVTGRSPVARARFAQERVAPPLPGLLTEGIAARDGTAGERPVLDLPTPPQPRLPRRGYVTGVFTAGAGAVVPPARTSVGDGRLARRPAPTTASVHGRLGRTLPISLTQAAVPAFAVGGTLAAVGGPSAIPRTDVPGAARTLRSGVVGAAGIQRLVGGLGPVAGRSAREANTPRAASAASPAVLRSGDVLTLALPDAHLASGASPSLKLSGRARVVAAAGAQILLDSEASDALVELPPGAAVVAVHCDPAESSPRVAGWHSQSRLAALGADAAFAAGCTLTTRGTAASAGAGWTTAAAFLRDSTSVTTRFPRAGRSLGIVVSGATGMPDAAFTLRGATRELNDAGEPVPPVATTVGELVVLIYPITPGDEPVVVVTPDGAAYQIEGVLTADAEPSDLATGLARDGLPGTVASLLATSGPGVSITWVDPAGQRSPRARRAPDAPRVVSATDAPLPRDQVLAGRGGATRRLPAAVAAIPVRRRTR